MSKDFYETWGFTMPTLNWIGKNAVENHDRDVPFHLLKDVPENSYGKPGSGNLIVEGDNLLALKALIPFYAGQVKCIFIDPPYNSGEQTWTYNDHVDSAEMRQWLGKTVGREAEDLTRHDKWLCMMYPRIKLLTQFLRDDGILFVCLDDTELYRFRVMMDDILTPASFITSFIWKSRRNLDSRSKHNVSIDHEYVLAFRKPDSRFRGAQKDLEKYSNPDNDSRGPWMSDNLVGLASKDRRPNLHYDLTNPNTGITYKCPQKGWRYSRDTMAQKIAEGRILWPRLPSGRPRHKKFQSELQSDFTGFSSLIECGNTNEGTEEVQQILTSSSFIFPKPRSLVEQLVSQVACSNGDIVLDSFAGSGTTGHAVLSLNHQDGLTRRFILIEMDADISQKVTSERLRRVCGGYKRADGTEVEGIGGGFRYVSLAEPLFDENGAIQGSVRFQSLAKHVFFSETGTPLPNGNRKSPLLGVHEGRAVYLLFNGILGDKNPNGGNVLTPSVLNLLPEFKGPKVIYGEGCRLGEARLKKEGVVFRQIPYEIRLG